MTLLVHSVKGWTFDDGGRAAAGYRGKTGDCVCRAIVIATGKPYQEVFDAIKEIRKSSARAGAYKDYIAELGYEWVPTMQIGSGCRVHARAHELPGGRLILRLSRHFTAMIDGVIRDTYDPSRGGTRCVYGYWIVT